MDDARGEGLPRGRRGFGVWTKQLSNVVWWGLVGFELTCPTRVLCTFWEDHVGGSDSSVAQEVGSRDVGTSLLGETGASCHPVSVSPITSRRVVYA